MTTPPPNPATPASPELEPTQVLGAPPAPPAPDAAGMPPRAAMALPTGTVLHGKFEVIDLIGAPGGFGIAYVCRDLLLERTVVVKELFPIGLVTRVPGETTVRVLRSELQASFALQRDLLLDEARRLAALAQVGAVVTVHDHFSENNTGYIVMHHVVGRPLGDQLRDSGTVDADQLMRWIWPLLDGLEAVHDAGVLHRDIKPDNLLIDRHGQPMLIDFGNAVARTAEARTPAGYAAVSPVYGAPEQYANDAARMGPWTDLYSVGALMYRALTGERPTDALQRLGGAPLPDAAALAPQAPRELLAAIAACLDLDETRRPADVRALRQLLAPLQPAALSWVDLLPDDDAGRRVRGVHQALREGRSLPLHPRHWNVVAGLTQAFWFFGHRLPLAGVLSTVVTLAVVAAVLGARDPLPALPAALALGWGLGLLPCMAVAEWLRHGQLQQVGSALPLAGSDQHEAARKLLYRLVHVDKRLAAIGVVLPLALAGLVTGMQQRQLGVQASVARAVELGSWREAFAAIARQQGRPPVADELPPFTPTSELRSVEARPGGLEVVLALPGLDGRRLRWRLDDQGRWHCEAVDLPARFTPRDCSLPP